MSTSQAGSVDFHDWKRIGEMLLQGFISLGLSNLLTVLPLLNWGRYQAFETVAILVLTEAAKRFIQSPTPAPTA